MKITDDMLTEWFPDFVDPTIEGVYEVENIAGTDTRFFSHWNRNGWSFCQTTPDMARKTDQSIYRTPNRSWRGLNKEPQRD